jgi:hypothetical protein
LTESPFVDSAGVPWKGRSFDENPWAEDDGETPEVIARALAATPFVKMSFVESLRGQRLLVPLIAEIGQTGIGPHGQAVDKSADLAIVAVATPDDRTAIPAFTSVSDMLSWKPEARPVPVSINKLCVAAVGEGHTRVIINPATHARALRRTELAALAQDLKIIDAVSGSEVKQVIASAVKEAKDVVMAGVSAGDPEARLVAEEIIIEVGMRPGLTAEELENALMSFVAHLRSGDLDDFVDSFKLKIISVI